MYVSSLQMLVIPLPLSRSQFPLLLLYGSRILTNLKSRLKYYVAVYIQALEKKVSIQYPPMKQLINNDGMTRYYTGLPSYAVFNIILSKLSPVVAKLGSVGIVELVLEMNFWC